MLFKIADKPIVKSTMASQSNNIATTTINDKKGEKVKEESNDLFCNSITDILRKFPQKKNFL